MSKRTGTIPGWCLAASLAVVVCTAAPRVEQVAAASPEQELAQQIFDATGTAGGLVVHLGCGDAELTVALAADDNRLVHGLDADAGNVQKARRLIRSLGLYGRVSVEQFDTARLPYTDNLVNLLVAEELGAVSLDEVMRVLAPGGAAYVNQGGRWTKTVKPRPEAIDEWTHFFHDASGNAVAQDSVVGPPHHMQWVGSPEFARSHEHLASVSAAVSSGGRIFYIADLAPPASIDLPSQWFLIARDAFNGVVLWKRSIGRWEWHHRPFRSGAPQLPRRLVAVGDTVYATLGYGAPLVALDAATGKVTRTYGQTDGTEEILYYEGVLLLAVGNPAQQRARDEAIRRGETPTPVETRVTAVEADTGKLLWSKSDVDTAELMPLTLAAGGGRVFFHTTEALLCLDAGSGKALWRAARPISLQRPAWSTLTVVVYGDVVIAADREPRARDGRRPAPQTVEWEVSLGGKPGEIGEMIAYSAASGERLWSCPCHEGYHSPVDVLIADGLLWSGDLLRARDPGITVARDPATGEIKRERPADQEFFTPGMSHHRCYRNKATERFLLLGRAGVELVDLKSGDAMANHWIRGACQYGVVPANGLLYMPSHTCACFIQTKLNGFYALAPERGEGTGNREQGRGKRGEGRLERGTARDPRPSSFTPRPSLDWPTYRHDAMRSGATATAVPAELKRAWQSKVGASLSSVVVAEGKLFVCDVDAYTLHTLDARDGTPLWSYTTGGRLDSPPTVHQGTILLGSADGHVYCLRASDGELVWRFRAGPEDRRVVAFDRLESAWPVHGSVLVIDNVAYFAAGRSTFLDGGVLLYGLDAATGEVVCENRLSGRDPETGGQPFDAVQGFGMVGVLPDVLSSDGESLYMRHVKFDRRCVEQEDAAPHLFSPTGFLDDSWWHRSYFIYGTTFTAGWGGWWRAGNRVPAGRLLVFDDKSIYGYGRNFYPSGNAGQWQTGEFYRLFSTVKNVAPVEPAPPKKKGRNRGPVKSTVECRWSNPADLEARAMVLAGQTLFIAGPLGETRRRLAAFEGEEGVRLRAVSTADGTTLAEHDLDSLPVFDGLIAAAGRLYLATRDGNVLCFTGR